MATLNERLVQLKNERNVMQKDIAAMLGLSVAGYQRYEYGTRQPTADVLIKLAEYFDVPTDYILGISDDPTRH